MNLVKAHHDAMNSFAVLNEEDEPNPPQMYNVSSFPDM